MKFQTILLQAGKTATGIEVPAEIVESLGAGKRPPVQVTINGHTYRSTIAVMGGRFMVGVSAEHRAAAGVKGGDTIQVTIGLDTAPRTVTLPKDFAAALKKNKPAQQFFDSLSYSNQLQHVLSVEQAKTEETRLRRIEKAIATLEKGKA